MAGQPPRKQDRQHHQRAIHHQPAKFIAHQRAVLVGPVASNRGAFVPDVQSAPGHDFITAIQQLQTQISFFRPAISGWQLAIISGLFQSRPPQQRAASDELMMLHRLRRQFLRRHSGKQNIVGQHRQFQIRAHEFDAARKLVRRKKPRIIVQAEIKIGIRLAHQPIFRANHFQPFVRAQPLDLGIFLTQ